MTTYLMVVVEDGLDLLEASRLVEVSDPGHPVPGPVAQGSGACHSDRLCASASLRRRKIVTRCRPSDLARSA